MATYGPNFPSTTSSNSSFGVRAWGTTSAISATDGSYSSISPTGLAASSEYLLATNFGFAIPGDETIETIEVTVLRKGNAFASTMCERVRLIKGGTIQTHDKATATGFPTTLGSITYGGDLWSNTWSPAEINASNFGIAFAAYIDFGAAADVDSITITVTTSGGGGGGGGAGFYNLNSFLTFRNIPIQKRVTVHKAFIRFTAQSAASATDHDNDEDEVNIMISGHDTDDSSPPETGEEAFDLDRTTSCINWDEIGHWTDETEYDSVDISCVVQEILDRAGWASGNDITIFLEDYASTSTGGTNVTRRAYDYDDTPAKAAKLLIYYTLDEEMDGGVVCNGTAHVSKSIQPAIVSAGVVCAGSAVVTSITTEVILPAGVVCSGTGDHATYNEVTTGVGLLAGGTANMSVDEAPNGGLVCGGSAHMVGSQTVVLTPAGLVCDSPKYLGRYYQRILITIYANSVPSDQVQFTWTAKLFIGSSYNVTEVAATDLSENRLPCKLAYYSQATGYLVCDTRLPLVAEATDTEYYVYF